MSGACVRVAVFAFMIGGVVAFVACSSGVEVESRPDGDSPAGEGCSSNSACASEVCTADVEAGRCGVCVTPARLGESCGGDVRCSPSAVCTSGVCATTKAGVGAQCEIGPLREDIGSCDDEGYCVAVDDQGYGVCIDRPALGEPCVTLTDTCEPGVGCSGAVVPCELGAACEGSTCVARAPRLLDESCDVLPCAAGLYCTFERVCHEGQLAAGMACGLVDGEFLDDDCVPGTRCGNLDHPHGGSSDAEHTCLPLPLAGSPCLLGACADGLYCDDRHEAADPICAPQLGLGKSCTEDGYPPSACAPGLDCRAGTCQPACD